MQLWLLMFSVAGGLSAVEGDHEGVERRLPAVGPASSALVGQAQGHEDGVSAFEVNLLVGGSVRGP